MKNVLKCITESLTKSTVSLVCALLAVPVYESGHALNYLMPIMFFYACMKSEVFLLQGAFNIRNPYKLLKCCIITAFVGSFFLLFENRSSTLYLIGAIITGVGLAPFSSLYKTVSKASGCANNNRFSDIISLVILIAFGFLCLGSKKSGDIFVFYFWCLYLFLICIYVFIMPGKETYTSENIFSLKEDAVLNSVPAIFLFVMMASVSGYKQSGNGTIFVTMLTSFILFEVWVLKFDKRHFSTHSAKIVWLGSVRSFEMLYALIFLTISNQSNLIMVLYFDIILSAFLSSPVKKLLSRYDDEAKSDICMAVSLFALLLVISQNTLLMFVGVTLCVSFTDTCKSLALKEYALYFSNSPDEYILIFDRMYSMGNGIYQAFSMIIFFMVGKLLYGAGNQLIKDYVHSANLGHNDLVLLIGGFICILVLFLVFTKLKRKPSD